MDYFDILSTACSDVGLPFDENVYNKLMQYKDMIKEWNEKINLTAITDDEQIIKKHFIDCIKIFKFTPLKKLRSIIDIGTGAGFPGMPMKIVKPDLDMILLDSLNKRVNFLNEVINKVKLENVVTIHGRAEDFSRKIEYREKIDAAVSRAVANLSVLSELCIPYIKVGGYFIAMKGPSVEEEIKEGKNAVSILGGKIRDIIEIEIEDSDLKHNLVIIEKVKETPKNYPRKAGVAAKKPLR